MFCSILFLFVWDNDIADSESLVINWVGLRIEPSANEGLRLNWLPASFVNKHVRMLIS